jgi:hypothetical protein
MSQYVKVTPMGQDFPSSFPEPTRVLSTGPGISPAAAVGGFMVLNLLLLGGAGYLVYRLVKK